MLQSSSSESDEPDSAPYEDTLVVNGVHGLKLNSLHGNVSSASNSQLYQPVPAPRNVHRDLDSISGRDVYVGNSTSRSNHSGSSGGSPPSASRTNSMDAYRQPSSFDTVSISSGISVPATNYDSISIDGGGHHTPRHSQNSGPSHSRSNSFRGPDRSPQVTRHSGGVSPTPSLISEKEREEMVKISIEEEDHKKRLQIYVFVLRCIAFPFNAKQPHDMQKRQTKISKQDLSKIKERFAAFLSGDTSIMADEAFKNAVQSYYEVFLKSDRVTSMVRSGACSASDFREVFKNNIEKRVRCLPEIDGLSKETVLSSWMSKFDSIYTGDGSDVKTKQRGTMSTANELFLSKDQLYDMFQNILSVKKYEHLILYNALQLDNPDEQAAQVRRELASRYQQIETKAYKTKPWKPIFVVKEMEHMYIDELTAQIQQLKLNLENVPVKGGNLQKSNKRQPNKPTHHIGKIEAVEEPDHSLAKLDVSLSFNIEIVIKDVSGLKIAGDKMIYCTMEMDGGDKLQTAPTPASKPYWETQGDFTTNQPLPHIKIRLMMETSSLLSLEDKELGKITLKLKPNSMRSSNSYVLTTHKSTTEDIKLKIITRMEKPQNMKFSGNLYAMGKRLWKTCKQRYFVLVQVSQYTFGICTYKEKKHEPIDTLQLKGFTVDYCEHQSEMDCPGEYYFNMVKEGDSVTFAATDEADRHGWVQALYRATGQSHKPSPPDTAGNLNGAGKLSSGASKMHGGTSVSREAVLIEIDKARKHGLDEFVSADPCEFSQVHLFESLQSLSLKYRISDSFTCMGWFSPGQIFILDEYVARYAVRGCLRHLHYLSDLLDKANEGLMIDPTLMHYSFAFCASHVYGNKPDGLGTITIGERKKFEEVRARLRSLLEYQITNFRFCFPFGRPEGSLKATLSLLERVLMKDMGSPIAVEEVKNVVKKCLENAALVNYTRITEFARIEETALSDNPPERLDEMTHLAGLCIEVLQQNEEHHADEFKMAFTWFSDILKEHNEVFWSLFAVDMDSCLESQPQDSWDSFALFTLLNSYLINERTLCDGKFHIHLRNMFSPLVIRYIDLMESSIAQSIDRGFSREPWESHASGCSTSDDMLWKLDALQSFIRELNWPDEVFAEHLEQRLKKMASDMIEAAGNRTLQAFDNYMGKIGRSSDFLLPSEMCVMINTLSSYKSQTLSLCIMPGESMHMYHAHIEQFLEGALQHTKSCLVERLLTVIDSTLSKLKRYDEGSLLKTFLSLTKPTDEHGKEYVIFVRGNLDMIRQKTSDEIYVNSLFENWYTKQIDKIHQWLADREDKALHSYQLTCLIHIVRKIFSDFELQGVMTDVLESKLYQTICNRLKVEEATHACIESRNARKIVGLSIDEGD